MTSAERMKRVRRHGTEPEVAIKRQLRAKGERYRTQALLPGTPDFVLVRRGRVLFVHGCFWHGHGSCRGGRLPKRNASFWAIKIERNKRRDQSVARKLRRLGWCVSVIWGCQALNSNLLERRLQRILR
jgi:DNA mismatch endonuclease (patch repair protein)